MSCSQTKSDLVKEAMSIISEAQNRGIILRIMGAIAFRIHCPKYGKLFTLLDRKLSDIDLVGYSVQTKHIRNLFIDLGYKERPLTLSLGWAGRLIFIEETKKHHVDVFLDELSMCHTIHFHKRLEIDYPTIPLADLLLEKMQIVKLNEKDIKDTIVLLLEHNIGQSDLETINAKYIAKTLSNDWGFYYTVITNLNKVKKFISRMDMLSYEEKKGLEFKINELIKWMEKEPKSLKWKIRGMLGSRKKWYKEVEDIHDLSIVK